MVLASSKTSYEFRPPQQQGMLTLTSHREEPDDSSAHRFHYAIASNGTEWRRIDVGGRITPSIGI
jgi:hypothetical protein